MRCAGISRWAIVDPHTLDFDSARRVAVHAEDLLDRPRLCKSLAEALEGCALSVGTTARPRPERPLITPREAAAKLLQARGEIAVVFGDERAGLTAEEVEAVDLLSSIPSDPAQPSWNLAQAIAVYAYELRMAKSYNRWFFARPVPIPPRSPPSTARSPKRPGSSAAAAPAAGSSGRSALEPSPREAALWTAFLRASGNVKTQARIRSLNHPAAAATSPSPTPSTQSSTASASVPRSADLRAASIAAANGSSCG